MKLKLFTNTNQSDPLQKQHILLLKLKGRGYFVTWALLWSSPISGGPGAWVWRTRPMLGWGVMK